MRKHVLFLVIALAALFAFTACASGGNNTNSGNSSVKSDSSPTSESSEETAISQSSQSEPENQDIPTSGSKILVTCFSRADENYSVGYIEKGNTRIIAEMIAEEVGADMFEIARVTPYPAEYNACTDEAKREQNENVRPELTASVENFDDYDIVFLGYPIWWSDLPMPVYSFIESYDFSGKTVIPFCTHAGSGLSGTVGTLRDELSDANVLDGLAISGTTAQNEQSSAKQTVLSWLDGIDAIN